MVTLDKIFQKKSIQEFEIYQKTNSFNFEGRDEFFQSVLSNAIRKKGNNEFFSYVVNFINKNYKNENTINNLIDLSIDYNDRAKYDIIKDIINDKDFYKRPPCNIYCFYKPEFISEFAPLLEVKDNKFEHLMVFVLNHTKDVYSEVMNTIIAKITTEQSYRLIGEALANSIIFNHPQGMHYFLEKSEQLDCWNEVQIYLETGLKQKGPANLRYEPKYQNCEDMNKLVEYLKESSYEGAQYYQDTVSRLNFYFKLDDTLNNKQPNKKMKI